MRRVDDAAGVTSQGVYIPTLGPELGDCGTDHSGVGHRGVRTADPDLEKPPALLFVLQQDTGAGEKADIPNGRRNCPLVSNRIRNQNNMTAQRANLTEIDNAGLAVSIKTQSSA